MNRALRAATTGALLVVPLALGACGAGQITQTANQERDKVGGITDAGDILLRAMEVAYPSGGAYEQGGDAELRGAIVNSGDEPDTLLSITGDAFQGVSVLGGPEVDPAATEGTVGSELDLEIARGQTLFLGHDEGPTVLLENLTGELTAGQSVSLTLTFETAGEVGVIAVVDNPNRSLDRGEPFDFHEGEEEHGEEAAAEEGAEAGGAEGGE